MVEVKAAENEKFKRNAKPFPIVAIGASAGGLEAITELLSHLPADTGMAYVYIQHLDRDRESSFTAILQRETKMTVRQIENMMPLETDHFYIIPPNTDISLLDGAFQITERAPKPIKHSHIDLFFLSMAEKQKEGSIGIVLSGSASDGSLGLKAIKMAGGITYAQDESAQFQSMPKCAIAENAVDAVLSPQEMALELVRLSKQKDLLRTVLVPDISDTAGENEGPVEEGTTDNGTIKPEELDAILKLLKSRAGVDFTRYKKTTIRRRIIRRMILHKLDSINEYIELLNKKSAETDLLFQDVLINVTRFFRDAEATDFLKKEILPELLKTKTINNPLRIWIPACSTGEEAYTMAMMILDIIGNNAGNARIQIFATDLSEIALAKARAGIYTSADVAHCPRTLLREVFC